MNRLSFQPVAVEGSTTMGLMPCVDGQPLAELVASFEQAKGFDVQGGYGGIIRRAQVDDVHLDPEDVTPSDSLFGRTGDGSVILLECLCGVEGCWPLLARVTTSSSTVIWDDFCQPHRPDRDYTGLGPFTFDIQDYLQAIKSVAGSASGQKRTPS